MNSTNNAWRLRLPGEMLVRDAITQMNYWFQTSAIIVSASGQALGILDDETIRRGLGEDADALLVRRCDDLVSATEGQAAA